MSERRRDVRKRRQVRQRERDSLSSVAQTTLPGQTVRHGTIGGYVTDGCRCDVCRRAMRDWQRARRASQPNHRQLNADDQVRAAVWRQKELDAAKTSASSDLEDLIREQEKDNHFVIFKRRGEVSLDEIWGDTDSGENHYERGGLPVLVARTHGYFEWDPPWLPPLIDRMDRELALRSLA